MLKFMFITVIMTSIFFEVSSLQRNYSEIYSIFQGIRGCFLLMFLLLDNKVFGLGPQGPLYFVRSDLSKQAFSLKVSLKFIYSVGK